MIIHQLIELELKKLHVPILRLGDVRWLRPNIREKFPQSQSPPASEIYNEHRRQPTKGAAERAPHICIDESQIMRHRILRFQTTLEKCIKD